MTLLLARRGFIAGLTSLFAAPALVRATSLDFIPRGAQLILDSSISTASTSYTAEDSLNYSYWVSMGGAPARMTAREILNAPRGVIAPWLPSYVDFETPRGLFRPTNEHQNGLMFATALDGKLVLKDIGDKITIDPVIVRLREEQEELVRKLRVAENAAARTGHVRQITSRRPRSAVEPSKYVDWKEEEKKV